MSTFSYKHLIGVILGLFVMAFLIAACQGAVTQAPPTLSADHNPVPTSNDPNLALNHPDEFNWQLFAQANQQAPVQVKVAGDKQTNNALWETWADDPCTFPQNPELAKPPTWDGCADVKAFRTRSQLSPDAQLTGKAGALACDINQINAGNPNCEEVHRNKSAFDFIIQHKLWYQEGQAEAFAAHLDVQFPIDAIEVKANWIPLPNGADKTQYHWNYDTQGNVWVLLSMHIMSKAVPNWTWATWEWEGNAGRCDYIGCHDNFGVIPANIASNPQPTPQPYPPGKLTPELLNLFKQYGLSDEWRHYRLKGSQTNFVDPTGRITLLGNSVTEAGFIQTSSCITCHSRASFNSSGQNALSVFQPTPPAAPPPDTARSYNGVPTPGWFYDESQNPTSVVNLPGDFVWALFNANSLTPAATPTP